MRLSTALTARLDGIDQGVSANSLGLYSALHERERCGRRAMGTIAPAA
jgi:hypothetical protein